MLGHQDKVGEAGRAIVVQVAGGERRAGGLVVVLGEDHQIGKAHGAIVVGVGSQYKKVEDVVVSQRVSGEIGDAGGGERGPVVSIRQSAGKAGELRRGAKRRWPDLSAAA